MLSRSRHALDHRQWDLRVPESALCWDSVALDTVAAMHGTPAYIASAARLASNVSAWMEAARGSGIPIRSYYSFKTCPVPPLLRAVAEAGFGAEIVSRHELALAARGGFSAGNMLYGGTARDREALAAAVDMGVHCIIVDTLDELRALDALAEQRARDVRIGVRLSAGVRARGTARINAASLAAHHFGFDPDADEFRDALMIVRRNPRLVLDAVHSHIGTGLRDMAAFARNFDALAGVLRRLRAEGFPLRILDAGGGLAVPTVKEFSALEFLRYAARGAMPSAPAPAASLVQDYFVNLASVYRRNFGRTNDGPVVYLEPGRAITSDAVLLLVRVASVRERGRRRIAVTDGGAMSTGLSVLGEYHEVFPVREPLRARRRLTTLVGRVPTPLDLLYRNKPMPDLRAGDLLAVMDAGAYMIPTSTNFASVKAPVVLLDRGDMRLLQRRETADDLSIRDYAHA